MLELQAHGGPVVLQLLLARCLEAGAQADPATGAPRLPGLRLAQPGEFTERAFLNDKIDLAQAEAIADLIDASTEAAARSASRSLSGEFSAEVHALRDALVHLRMLVEATLDFPEEDIDFLQQADARGQLERLRDTLARVLQRARQGALLREGIKVVLAGQPNAGKSSLLNALAGAELAIVTPVPGTTRDVVSQTIQIEGVPLHVIDTAGLRDSQDHVEKIGIERAWGQIEKADAVLFLHDLTRSSDADYQAGEASIARSLVDKLATGRAGDRRLEQARCRGAGTLPPAARAGEGVALSAKTGAGLDTLRQRLLQVAGWQSAPGGRVHRPRAPRAGAAPRRRPPGRGGGPPDGPVAIAGAAGGRAAPGAERAQRNHRRVHVRRPAGRDLLELLHRQVATPASRPALGRVVSLIWIKPACRPALRRHPAPGKPACGPSRNSGILLLVFD